jgi:hypothetical protein
MMRKNMTFDKTCKYAPSRMLSKHCKKQNEGIKAKKGIGKGYFGCIPHCRFYEAKT